MGRDAAASVPPLFNLSALQDAVDVAVNQCKTHNPRQGSSGTLWHAARQAEAGGGILPQEEAQFILIPAPTTPAGNRNEL